jgi:hypothetical protein
MSQSGAFLRVWNALRATHSMATPAKKNGTPKRTDFQPSMAIALCVGCLASAGGEPGVAPSMRCWSSLASEVVMKGMALWPSLHTVIEAGAGEQ